MFMVPATRSPSQLLRSFDRLFDDAFERFLTTSGDLPGEPAARAPAIDVSETPQKYTVTADLPGVPKDAVKVSIDGKRVSIEAEVRKQDEKKEGDRVVYRERSYSRFARTFTLPVDVDQAASSAKLDNGVLTLELAKRNAPAAAQLTVN
jgi:HSP20 family protein